MFRVKSVRSPSLLVVLLLALVLAGCNVFQSEGGGQDGGGTDGGGGGGEENETLNTYEGADIPDLNSTTTTDAASFDVLVNTNEGLYRLDENEEPVPAMAEGVEVSDDQLTYTFTLRDGVTWSSGDPVTSEDFRYAWLRAMNPDTAGQYAFILSEYIDGGAEFAAGEGGEDEVAIETPDDQTIEVTLANPTPFFLDLTAFVTYFPLKQDFVEEQGDDFGLGVDSILYNGPYTMTEFDSANRVVLEKNEDYWDADNVDIERVDVRVVKDTQTALNLYESGELDAVGLVSEDVDRFRDSPEFHTRTEFTTFWMGLNQEDPAMANENIRRAIQLGYDRQAYVDTLLNNGSVPANGVVPIGMEGPEDQTFREAQGDVVSEFDPEQAREYWERGVEELGEAPTLELLSQDSSVSRDASAFFQSQFEENLGAEVTINTQPFDAFLDIEDAGDYQISTAQGWGADYNDPMTYLELFTTDSPFNRLAFSNEQYDQLIADAKVEPDTEARMQMMLEAERLLLEEQAVIAPIYHRGIASLRKPYLGEVVNHPYGAQTDYKYWTLEGK